MKKAVVFPINYDTREIIQYNSMIQNYSILFGIVYEEYEEGTFPEEKVINLKDFKKQNMEYEAIILLSSIEDESSDIYIDLIQNAIMNNKEIILNSDLYDVFYELLKDYINLNVIANSKSTLDIVKKIYEQQEVKMLKNIETPIISIIGMGDYCNKFSCELELRKFFLSENYRVLQIGSKEFANLFGFDFLPEFLFEHSMSLEEKAFLFNFLISYYEKKYSPDIIIIGVPGGVIPVNSKILNNLGEILYVVANSVKVDISVLCVYYNALNKHIIDEYVNCCRYRFNTKIEHILASNTAFTFNMDNGMRSLKYFHLKRGIIRKDTEINDIYDLSNIEFMIDSIYNKLLNGIEVL